MLSFSVPCCEKEWSYILFCNLKNYIVSTDHLQSWCKAFMEWFALFIGKYWTKTPASPSEVANQCYIVYIAYPVKQLQVIVGAYLFRNPKPCFCTCLSHKEIAREYRTHKSWREHWKFFFFSESEPVFSYSDIMLDILDIELRKHKNSSVAAVYWVQVTHLEKQWAGAPG